MAKETLEEARHSAGHRMTEAATRAKIAESAYDKPGYAKYKKQSLDAGNEALAANEKIKSRLNAENPVRGGARAAIATRGNQNAAAGRAAEAALTGRRFNAQTTDSNQ